MRERTKNRTVYPCWPALGSRLNTCSVQGGVAQRELPRRSSAEGGDSRRNSPGGGHAHFALVQLPAGGYVDQLPLLQCMCGRHGFALLCREGLLTLGLEAETRRSNEGRPHQEFGLRASDPHGPEDPPKTRTGRKRKETMLPNTNIGRLYTGCFSELPVLLL